MSRKTATTPVLQDKFLATENFLNSVLFERHAEVRGLLLAAVAKKHIFLYGPPGVAKSYAVNLFSNMISGLGDNGFFKWQMNKTTNDSEIVGPTSLTSLREDRFKRITTRKLPEAYFAFLDEGMRGSSSILNILLKMLEERQFDNDEEDPNIPLITMVMAANSLPSDPELMALADRLHLWYSVQPIRDPSNLVGMLRSVEPEAVEQIINIADIEEAQRQARSVVVGDEVLDSLLEIKDRLSEEGILISDRRLRQSLSIIQAEAWLNGNTHAAISDMSPLQHMFWRDLPEITTVRNVILNLVDPLELQVRCTIDDLNAMVAQLEKDAAEKDSPQDRTHLTNLAIGKWKEGKKEYEQFRNEEQRIGRPYQSVAELKSLLPVLINRILSIGYGTDKVADIMKKLNLGIDS